MICAVETETSRRAAAVAPQVQRRMHQALNVASLATLLAKVGKPLPHRLYSTLAPPTPEIRVSHDVGRVADKSIDALAQLAEYEPLYQRDGKLVRVVRVETPRGAEPAIDDVKHPTLREYLSNAARWKRFDKRSKRHLPCAPDDQIVAAVKERREYPGIDPIAGIAETPIMRPDGSILTQPGYDRATGLLYVPAAKFPPIPARPTQADARRALAELVEVFCDFPYRAEADQMVPIAALLTLLGRSAIDGCVPAFGFDANVAGAGKGLQAEGVGLIAHGRIPATTAFPIFTHFLENAQHVREDELGKILDTFAMQGASVVYFDNVAGPFGGAPLDMQITSRFRVPRILGKNEMPRLPWLATILVTGNNLVIVGDTTRRVLISRIVAPEDPESRTNWTHPDLKPWIKRERPRLVTAALTLLRAYILANPARACDTWGSFEAWSALVPEAIVFAGGADPMACRIDGANAAAVNPELEALRVLIARWNDFAPDPMTCAEIIRAIFDEGSLDASLDSVREALVTLTKTKQQEKPTGGKLAGAFRRVNERVVDGRCIKCVGEVHKTGLWTLG